VPDRRLFLDYCHLTLDGMRHAMAAVTEAVLEITGPPSRRMPPRDAIRASFEPQLPAEMDAQVKFMSMLYGAHYGCDHDPYSGEAVGAKSRVSEHWLSQARHASGDIDQLLLTYARLRNAPFHSFGLSAEQQRMHLSLTELEGQTSQSEGLDADVVNLILAQLRDAQGTACDAVIETLIEHHAVERAPADLCNAAHHWSLAERQYDGGGYSSSACALMLARWPCSHYCFVSAATHPLHLLVTARLPLIALERRGPVALLVNGEEIGEMDLETSWTHGKFEIPSALLRRGHNKLTLEWPPLPAEGDEALEQIIERLEMGVPVDVHPVFGEVQALKIGVRRV